MRALAELVDDAAVAEDPVDLPVRCHGAGVDDLHVPTRWDLFFELFGFHRHHGPPTHAPATNVAGGCRLPGHLSTGA